MKIELLNQIQLDKFVSTQPHSQFLQSWHWGEFQKAMGHGVWRLGVFNDENKLITIAQIIQHKLPLKKSYLYCARGPVFANDLTADQKTEALKLILSKARDITIITSQTEEFFFRLEPSLNLSIFQSFNLQKVKDIQPATTLILDLTMTEAQLLEKMHPKTRYNIKVAERHGLTISEEKNFENVWPLFQQTSKRDGFHLHPKNYYQKMLEVAPWIKLWLAKYQNQNIAAVIISYFGDTATYLHGTSDYNYHSLMAPYLLHWKIIQNLKNSNNQIIKYYDFYGIAPTTINNQQATINKHPWAGITRFKLGFGGQIINYPGTYDFIYQPGWYKIYKTLRTINLFLRKI